MRAIPGQLAVALWGRLRDGYRRVVEGPPAFRCNVCGRAVRAFRPLPRFFADQLQAAGWPHSFDDAETCHAARYSCPRCGASDRDRLMALDLAAFFVAAPAAPSVLDFAPSAALSPLLRRDVRAAGGSYRTADLSGVGVDDTVDITAMPGYATGSYDLLICSHVLEHVSDDRKAMREIFRVLKPSGRALLMVPIVLGLAAIDEDPTVTDETERWRRFGQGDHVRLYSKDGFVARLIEAGFVVHQLGAAHFGAEMFEVHGVSPQSVLYVAEKPARHDETPGLAHTSLEEVK